MTTDQRATPLPDIFIGSEKVYERANLYLDNKRPLLTQALNEGGGYKEETKSVWYSKEHIETWLAEINLMDADGMRIYFGAYEHNSELAPDQLCLVMMLTRPKQNGQGHEDIIYENEPGFDGRAQITQSRSFNTSTFDSEGTPRPFNYGAPCPPIC